MSTRRPAVAGLFYPADPAQLAADVARHLSEAVQPHEPGSPPKAVIAPHAGYAYSGPVAGSAFSAAAHHRGEVERVVLLGPSHRVPVDGLAVPRDDVFETPLGGVPLDRPAIEAALALPQVVESDAAHREEHSLEVQLPFLQEVLGPFHLVPFSVGQARAEEVAEVLDLLWGGPETLVVISSDLSHYHDYDAARDLDAATTRAIESLDPGCLGEQSACGRIPVSGLLLTARRRGLAVRTLDIRSSGYTAGTRDRVVGYGAWSLA